jgi:hypothetical protein
MAKDKSFAAKMAKATMVAKTCPKCGEVGNMSLVVSSEKKESKDSWIFKEKMVRVCKCNEKEVYA